MKRKNKLIYLLLPTFYKLASCTESSDLNIAILAQIYGYNLQEAEKIYNEQQQSLSNSRSINHEFDATDKSSNTRSQKSSTSNSLNPYKISRRRRAPQENEIQEIERMSENSSEIESSSIASTINLSEIDEKYAQLSLDDVEGSGIDTPFEEVMNLEISELNLTNSSSVVPTSTPVFVSTTSSTITGQGHL